MESPSILKRLRLHYETASGAVAGMDDRAILSEVRMVGGGMIIVLVVAMVMTEMYGSTDFETDGDGNYVGPFGDVLTSLESTGTAAMTLLVVGFLVVSASAIMRTFGSGFGGGR